MDLKHRIKELVKVISFTLFPNNWIWYSDPACTYWYNKHHPNWIIEIDYWG